MQRLVILVRGGICRVDVLRHEGGIVRLREQAAEAGLDGDARASARRHRIEEIADCLDAGRAAKIDIAAAHDHQIAGTPDLDGKRYRVDICRRQRPDHVAAGGDAGDIRRIVVLPDEREIDNIPARIDL